MEESTGSSRVNVQSIRARFEARRTSPRTSSSSAVSSSSCSDQASNSSESDTNRNSPTGFLQHGRDGRHGQQLVATNRVSIKRSPAFRTGTKNGNAAATTPPAINEPTKAIITIGDGGKKPSLKRKPGVDRSSKPGVGRNGSSCSSSTISASSTPDAALEEALRAPLPCGPAPKKPPRTFQHDIYLIQRLQESAGVDETDGQSPNRPSRRLKPSAEQPLRPTSLPFTMNRSKTEPFLLSARKTSPPSSSSSSSSPGPPPDASQWNRFSGGQEEHDERWSEPNCDGLKSSLPTASLRQRQQQHVYDQPSTEGDLHYMCSPIVMVTGDGQTCWPGMATPTDESSEAESDEINDLKKSQLVQDRKIYVRRVSSNVCDLRKASSRPLALLSSQTTSSSASPTSSPPAPPPLCLPVNLEPGKAGLFETLLVVGLYYDRLLHRHTPYIKSSYPSHAMVPPGVEHFCFPDSAHWPPPPVQSASAPYTVVLTDSKGERMFGYCRRIVPEGAHTCIPITYCLLSRHRAAGFYNKLLNVLVSRHGMAESQRTAMLDYLYRQDFPRPGRTIELPDHSPTGVSPGSSQQPPPPTKIQRLLDGRLEDVDLRVLFEQLNETVVLHVLGTVLLERKLIFVSQDLSTLSLCVDAVQSMLYPFVWQHTLVPVLPSSMTEIASAPTPFVLGMLTPNVDDWKAVQPDQGMLVDLDSGKVLHCVGDESTILPRRSIRRLMSDWDVTVNITQQAETARNALYSESFLRVFVDLCGHYGQHIHTAESGHKYFERAVFARSHSNAGVRDFLEWFTETAMFSLFIEGRLRDDAGPTLFDHKILEHSMQQLVGGSRPGNGQLILPNSRVLGRKIKTIGDKLREMNVFS